MRRDSHAAQHLERRALASVEVSRKCLGQRVSHHAHTTVGERLGGGFVQRAFARDQGRSNDASVDEGRVNRHVGSIQQAMKIGRSRSVVRLDEQTKQLAKHAFVVREFIAVDMACDALMRRIVGQPRCLGVQEQRIENCCFGRVVRIPANRVVELQVHNLSGLRSKPVHETQRESSARALVAVSGRRKHKRNVVGAGKGLQQGHRQLCSFVHEDRGEVRRFAKKPRRADITQAFWLGRSKLEDLANRVGMRGGDGDWLVELGQHHAQGCGLSAPAVGGEHGVRSCAYCFDDLCDRRALFVGPDR